MNNLKKWGRTAAVVGTMMILASGCSLPFSMATKTDFDNISSEQDNQDSIQNGQNSAKGDRKQSKKNSDSADQNKVEKSEEPPSTEKNSSDKPMLKETIKVTTDGTRIITNPASLLVCANKQRNLPADYIPQHLVIPDIRFIYGPNAHKPNMQIRKIAAQPIENLFHAANEADIHLFGVSGYRSYDYQVTVFARNVKEYGSEEEANQVSAHPGQSEHQTGLTMDVTAPSVDYRLTQKFGQTKAGKWLAAHAWKYGFIIRYPKGEHEITGYEYEPWHIRYVGKKAAKVIAEKDLTLEEYLSK
ncbi:MAG TPA: M15 family metallopeptidase [Bacillales bacterium]